jgi:hypothetical protein
LATGSDSLRQLLGGNMSRAVQPGRYEDTTGAQVVRPMDSPYFRPQDQGSGTGTLGSGAGVGFLPGLESLPGADAFYRQAPTWDSQASFDPQALAAYLEANGLQIMERPNADRTVTRWVQDASGNAVVQPQTMSTNDDDFYNFALLVGGGVTAANIAAAGAAGGAAGSVGSTASASSMPAVAGQSAGIAGAAPAIASAPAIGAGVSGGAAGGAAAASGGSGMWGQLALQAGSAALQSRAVNQAAQGQMAAANTASGAQLQAQREALEANRLAQERTIAAQREALEMSLGEQRRQYDTTRADWQPWRDTGMGALEQLRGLMNYDPTPTAEAVMAEPGYQFGLTQGRNIMEGSAAARGGLYSGQAMRELTQYGNDYATGRYGDAWNRAQANFGNRWGRISALAGLGQTATQQVGAAGQNMANAATSLYGNQANALSNAAQGGANSAGSILMGTAGNVGNIWMGNANAQGAAGMQQANIWGNALNQLAGYGMSQGGQGGSWNGYDFSGGPYRGG